MDVGEESKKRARGLGRAETDRSEILTKDRKKLGSSRVVNRNQSSFRVAINVVHVLWHIGRAYMTIESQKRPTYS